jgi:maleate isomerase
MYGWRGKIGLLVPSTNFTVEMEFHNAIPEGVSVHTARCVLRDTAVTEEDRIQAIIDMGEDVLSAAQRVAGVRPKVIAWACTAGSFMKGIGHDMELITEVERGTGIKALTTSTAGVDALKALEVRKVAVATPYIQKIYEEERLFLEQSISDLQVTKITGLGIIKGFDKGNLEPNSAYMAAKEIDSSKADAIFISCTAWRTLEIIETLESDVEKPVITSNQATLWACLKVLGIHGIKGYGKLMELL